MMDCNNARLVLLVAHPLATELHPRDQEELASHLAECPECGAWAESERRIDAHLAKAMKSVPVPADLSLRLCRRLHVQRDAWYRGWAIRAAGAAAMLFLALWLGWALWWNKKPVPDLAGVRFELDVVAYGQVEQYFASRGINMSRPPKFNYDLLDSFGLAEFPDGQKRLVPYLLFACQVQGSARPYLAQVYVLSDQQFDIDEVRKQAAPAGSGKSIAIQSDPENQNVIYVVVFSSGAQLQMFFKADGPKIRI